MELMKSQLRKYVRVLQVFREGGLYGFPDFGLRRADSCSREVVFFACLKVVVHKQADQQQLTMTFTLHKDIHSQYSQIFTVQNFFTKIFTGLHTDTHRYHTLSWLHRRVFNRVCHLTDRGRGRSYQKRWTCMNMLRPIEAAWRCPQNTRTRQKEANRKKDKPVNLNPCSSRIRYTDFSCTDISSFVQETNLFQQIRVRWIWELSFRPWSFCSPSPFLQNK